MRSPSQRVLPEYADPPVNEVLIAIEFAPIVSWQPPHAGLYWSHIRADYPGMEVHPPIIPLAGQDGDLFQTQAPRLEFAQPGLVRTWFLSQDKTRLIQIQRDRFILTWRKVSGNEQYPRFDNVLFPEFVKEFSRFKSFLKENLNIEVDITYCELTYVNHLVQGREWVVLDDLFNVMSYLALPRPGQYLPQLETFNMSGAFRMNDAASRLTFQIIHALRQTDDKQIMQMTLTARGRPNPKTDGGVSEWITIARSWIVNGFTELTTESAHKKWGRIR
jgi:uncharacterized protein (TIGR04255 family)